MEEKGGVVEEEGAAQVRNYDLRSLFSRLRPEGFERPHVLEWLNCNYFMYSTDDATFAHGLKIIFLCLLTVALLTILFFEQIFNSWHTSIGLKGTVPLFAAVLVAAVFVTNPPKMSARSAPPRREQVQTASALVQQV